jgi:cell division septation protein DedD
MAPAAGESPQTTSAPSETKTVELPAPAAAMAANPEPGYTIQVAASPTEREARRLVERLTAEGRRAYLSRALVKDVEVFRVRVGPFDTRSEAEDVAVQLHRDGYDRAWIAR